MYPGSTERCGVGRLVRYEPRGDIRAAIPREHTMKRWFRAPKVRTALDMDPGWSDLFDTLNA